MQCPNPNLAAISVGSPFQMVYVQLKVNSAMHVEAITTTLHCASKMDTGKTSSKEALSPASATPAVDITPAAPHVGITVEVIAHVAIPGPHPAAASCIPAHGTSPRHSSHSKRCSTPHRYYQDATDMIPADSITTGSQAEGKLYTESASNGQVAFYTCLQHPA